MSDAARSVGRREAALSAMRAGRLFLESDSYRDAISSFSAAAEEPLALELSDAERASVLCGLARCHLALGSHEDARRCVKRVESLSLPDDDRVFVAEAQVILARTEAKAGRFAASLAAARRAYEALSEGPDSPLLAEASKALGTAHAEQGDVTEARDCFTECLVCCRRLEDEEGVAGAYNNLGILAKRSGDLTAAVDCFEHALEIDERLGRTAAVARRLNNLGIALYRMSRWDEAEKHLLRALDIFGRLGATRDVVAVESALGNLRRVRRDWAGARRYFNNVLVKSRESGYFRAEALALEFLGDLEKDVGNHAAALSSLNLSLARARKLSESSDVVGEALRRRAEVFVALGRLDEAERDCLAALELCARIRDRLEEGSTLRVLAAVRYARGDLASARATVERAENALRATGSTFEIAMVAMTEGVGLARAIRRGRTERELSAGPAEAGDRVDGGFLDRNYVEARLCSARELFRVVGSEHWAAVCAAEVAGVLCDASETDRGLAWLEEARRELAASDAGVDHRALDELEMKLRRQLDERRKTGGNRYGLAARAARLLDTGGDRAQSLYAFASLVAESVSADRVVVFRVDAGREPTIVTTADVTGCRLAEVRRFVRSVRDVHGLASPLVRSTSGTGRPRLPRHLAAAALLPSAPDVEKDGGYLLYADRLRGEDSGAFSLADVELMGAAVGLLGRGRETSKPAADGTCPSAPGALTGLISRDPAMLRILENVKKLGRSDIPVLILGESGVGKEIIARAIHSGASRGGKLVALNSAAIPRELQESELFGHVKGAFTDADRDTEGLIEAAANGTLFLDEISDMSPGLQVKLLRFLQSGEYRRVGDNAVRRSNARVISASNRDLREQVAAGSFRRDLFYRLSTFVIEIPPLRGRPGDIGPLMDHFLKMYARIEGKDIAGYSDEVVALFMSYDWHGNNVRELENEVRRAVAFCESGDLIRPEHLRPELAGLHSGPSGRQIPGPTGGTLRQEVEALERSRILDALAACAQSKQKAAESLGLSRTGLYTKMRKYGIA